MSSPCQGCSVTHYCSEACKLEDKINHTKECPILQAFPALSVVERLFVHLVVSVDKDGKPLMDKKYRAKGLEGFGFRRAYAPTAASVAEDSDEGHEMRVTVDRVRTELIKRATALDKKLK